MMRRIIHHASTAAGSAEQAIGHRGKIALSVTREAYGDDVDTDALLLPIPR